MTTGTCLLEVERERHDYGRHLNPVRLGLALEVMQSPVLDLGCATGAYVRQYRARGHEAYGLDLLLPREKHSWTEGAFVASTCARLPFREGALRTVTAFEVLEHLDQPETALAEIARVLRGCLVLSVPDATRHPSHEPSGFTFHHWVDRTHRTAFTPGSLRDLLAVSGFTVESIRPMNFVVPEVLVLDQYRLPRRVASLMLRVLRGLPGRHPQAMTILAVARRAPS